MTKICYSNCITTQKIFKSSENINYSSNSLSKIFVLLNFIFWRKCKKIREIRKNRKIYLFVLKLCGYSNCAQFLPKHDVAIICTIEQLLRSKFKKIWGNGKICKQGVPKQLNNFVAL